MLYIINAWDKPGTADLVAQTLEAHQHYLHESEHLLVLAGGMRSEDGKDRLGSVYLVNTPSRKAAEDWLAGEPFYKAGIFKTTTLEKMRKAHWHPENAPKTVDGA
jgi:uncharacterized protein YciI